MAWRLRLVPEKTNIDFFRLQWITFGASIVAMLASVLLVLIVGLNYGVDFKGGTAIRVDTKQPMDIEVTRAALGALDVGDVSITDVQDPAFAADQHVLMVRFGASTTVATDEAEVVAPIERVKTAILALDQTATFPSVEVVGPKVSGELIWKAFMAVAAASFGILVYVWLRFEWQFAVGTVVALIHDVVVTVGVFALFQLKFDLTIVAALLTILGYSVNDTVVIFDRLRENLIKFKTTPLRDLMNLTANETLSRTIMTATTTLIALAALLIFGGDVIRGFVFAMFFGVIVGTYSTLYVAKNIVLMLGVKRDWSKPSAEGPVGTQFG